MTEREPDATSEPYTVPTAPFRPGDQPEFDSWPWTPADLERPDPATCESEDTREHAQRPDSGAVGWLERDDRAGVHRAEYDVVADAVEHEAELGALAAAHTGELAVGAIEEAGPDQKRARDAEGKRRLGVRKKWRRQ